MRGKDIWQKFMGSRTRRIIAIAVMVTLLAGIFSMNVFAQNSYVITDGDAVTVHKSYSDDPDVVLDEVGIELSEEDSGLIVSIVIIIDKLDPIIANPVRYLIKYSNSGDEIVIAKI